MLHCAWCEMEWNMLKISTVKPVIKQPLSQARETQVAASLKNNALIQL